MTMPYEDAVETYAEALAPFTGAEWRTGRHVPRNLYARAGGDPDEDVPIGTMDTVALAQRAVNDHNGVLTTSGDLADARARIADLEKALAKITADRDALRAVAPARAEMRRLSGSLDDQRHALAADIAAERDRLQAVIDDLQPGDSRDIAIAENYRRHRDEMAVTLTKYHDETTRLITENERLKREVATIEGTHAAEIAGLMPMGLRVDGSDTVARCLVGSCQWHSAGDNSTEHAVTDWASHLTSDHRDHWPED